MTEFDVIVLGSGPAGEVLAGRTATAGLKTAIIESELVGGECSYWACVPSKALLKPQATRRAAEKLAGLESDGLRIDAEAVLRHRDEVVENFDDAGQVKLLDSKNITLFRGHGRLAGDKKLVVSGADGDVTITATKAVVVATGSSAAMPPIKGIENTGPWDSRNATSAKVVPNRLAIIGGGVVAVEMAQAWQSLGAQVTILVRGERLLDSHEPFAGDLLNKAFADDGIDVRLNTSVTEVHAGAEGKELLLDSGETVAADEYLVAIGRSPRTKAIGLETVGLSESVGQYLAVDEQLRVKGVEGDWLYAIGDVNGRALVTHMGKYQGRIGADVITGGSATAWADHSAVPGVVFTDPQVAQVGVTEAAARASGLNVRAVHFALTETAASWLNGDKYGGATLVIDEDRRVVVGATFVGSEVAELLHSATIAIAGEVTVDKLMHAVPSFPTLSEVWLSLLEEYGL